MISYLRQSYLYQIAALAITAATTWWVTAHTPYVPLVRLGGETLIQGVLAGLLASACSLILVLALTLRFSSMEQQFISSSKNFYGQNIFRLVGAIMSAVVVEEILLRGLMFGTLERWSVVGAFAVNALTAFILWLDSPRRPLPAAIRAAEASLYAAFLFHNRSLFMVVVAHLTAEAIKTSLLRQPSGAAAAVPARFFRAGAWLSLELRNRFGIKLKKRSTYRK